MKTLVTTLFVLLSWAGFAGNAGLFTYSHSHVEKSLATVQVLDRYVTAHHGDMASVMSEDNVILKNYLASDGINIMDKGPDSLLGIPPFWWGFLLSWVGILLVYFLTEQNKEYTKEALIGCVVGSLVYVGFSFLWGGCWGGWWWW